MSARFVVYIDHQAIASGTLEQASKLVALLDEMGVVKERGFYLKDYSDRRDVVYPSPESRMRIDRISGQIVWADSKDAAEAMEREAKAKDRTPLDEAPPAVEPALDMSVDEMLTERTEELVESF